MTRVSSCRFAAAAAWFPVSGSRKGNVFTIEAVFGALLFMLFTSSILAYANSYRSEPWTVPDDIMVNDIMAVLERSGTLEAMDMALIEQQVGLILRNDSSYRLELVSYNFTDGAFAYIGNASVGMELPEGKAISAAERGFFSTSNGSISNYTMARLYIWR